MEPGLYWATVTRLNKQPYNAIVVVFDDGEKQERHPNLSMYSPSDGVDIGPRIPGPDELVNLELLRKVIIRKQKWEEAYITGPESEAEVAKCAAYQTVLDFIDDPNELRAEAKRLGLEVDDALR